MNLSIDGKPARAVLYQLGKKKNTYHLVHEKELDYEGAHTITVSTTIDNEAYTEAYRITGFARLGYSPEHRGYITIISTGTEEE